MKRLKKLTVFLLALLMLTSMFTACSAKSKSEKIVMGYIGPITGEMALYGEVESNTLKMLVEETNAKGGILGKQIELKIYDNRGDAIETTNAARKAVQNDHVVAFIGCNTSSASLTLAEVCEEYKIPMITTTATNYSVTQRDDGSVRDYVFRVVLSDPQLGQVMASYTYNKLNIKKVAILYEVSSDYSVGLLQNFTTAFKDIGGQITVEEAYKTGDVDFRAQLSKIKQAGNYEAIFIPALYKELGLIANQARSLGITEQFIGPDCWMMEDLFTIATDSMQGGVFPCAMDVNADSLKEFKDAYQKKYNSNPGQGGTNAFFAYDSFLLLKHAIEAAGEVDSTKIRDAIENTTDLKGLTSTINMKKDTHNPIREATIFKIDNGKFVAIDSYAVE
ncbi:ABC transporter substrate-binding protein [Petroclostridium sp. X23]|uniref:ABC transporter substrate-binding protein n=1 Tax=Petroclostridium sp. X23 TaxID=3045146 RepID=UPI0024AD7577|nr:ABC transporter substrate-binding protein [Petroclostridium sp. X23]WHH61253.1 ABC transporter substrate-binding protein [Petroclostridium sp. X23]